jgi:hypothetical protein
MTQLELHAVTQYANPRTAVAAIWPLRARAALRAVCALFGLLLALAAVPAAAQLTIEITGAGEKRLPIAIVPLAGEGVLPSSISSAAACSAASRRRRCSRIPPRRRGSITPSGARGWRTR